MAAFVPVALLLAACGGDDGAASNDKWYGNWNRTGTQSTTCGLLNDTTQLTGILVIGAGSMRCGTSPAPGRRCARRRCAPSR